MAQEFDVVVVGAGSGLNVAAACARNDLETAVIEKGPMGGTCLNRGCIPSKMLIHSADVAETIERSGLFGIEADIEDVDFPSIIERVNEIVDEDARRIEESYEDIDNPQLFKGEARFTGERVLEVDLEDGGKETIKGDKFVLAHGARPNIPPIDGLDEIDYMTSTEALRLEEQPDHLVIVGGGYIAAEMAHFYGSLGTDVTIIQRNVRLVPNEDRELGERFTEIAGEKWDIHLESTASRVEKEGDTYVVTVEREEGESFEVEGDGLLIATGVKPNSDILQVEETGVETNEYGFVENDDHLETNVEGIFTLGDAAGNYLFKHTANYEAQYVTHNILSPDEKQEADYTAMPHAIFSSPQVAGVGKTEQELEEEGIDYLVTRYDYIDTGMGEAIRDEEGFVKFLVDERGKILGCHILGSHASTLIHEVLVAMRAGSGTVHDLYNTVHIHPALSEVVDRAASARPQEPGE